MTNMRLIGQASLALAAMLAVGAADARNRNFSVDSVNQPVVAGDRATVPNCPNWKSAGLDSGALTDTNYGCAINSNLAAMVANPADLVHGRTDPATGTDPLVAVKAVKAFREKEPTGKQPLEKVSSKGGN